MSVLTNSLNSYAFAAGGVETKSARQIYQDLNLSFVKGAKAVVSDKSTFDTGYLVAIAAALALHIGVFYAYKNQQVSVVAVPKKHQVEIQFIKPEVIPPPPVEPPKPVAPPPKKLEKVTPPPKVEPALKTRPADEVIQPSDIVVAENKDAAKTTGPVTAASEPTPPAAPPAPAVEEPITEASANAGYLNNPKPEYPASALRQGWGGTVILRVRVLANGTVESLQIKKSSGKKVLDEAASTAVKNWTFVPSKRGSTPIDGWATVPVVFNPEQ